MEFIEKLLDGVEVEWLLFSEVGEFLRGKRFVKADMMSEGVPCIHYGEMYTHFGVWADQTKSFLDEDLASKLRVANTGDVIIVAAGETIEDIGNGTDWLGVDDVVFHDACFSFKSTLDPKYVSYYLRTTLFKDQIKKSVSSGKISSINAKGLGKAEIPIPCPDNPKKSLEIQAEIVRILDAFTAMTAELTAELNLRKKQYNYYRDQLLSFEEGEVEWKTLGEVALIGTGRHDTKDAIADGDYIFYARGREPLKLDVFDFNETAIITAGDGAGVGKVYHYAQGKYALHQRAYRIVPGEFMEPRFVYHYVSAYFYDYIQKASVSSSVTSLRRPMFLKFPIPVLPLEEQARIVAILDKFDALTNSITEGLPREIELRQKQYEYYRDLLLSFPRPDAEKTVSHT